MTKKPALKRKRGAAIKSRAKSPNMMSGGIAIKIKKIPAKKAMILRSQLLSMLPKTRSHNRRRRRIYGNVQHIRRGRNIFARQRNGRGVFPKLQRPGFNFSRGARRANFGFDALRRF